MLILLLCIATVSFCFLLSSLFNRSKIGSILSSMFYVVGYFLTFAASISDGNKNVINVVSLHPFTAFSYGIELISEFEDKAQGMTSENVNDSPYASDYKYRDAIMMLIIDTILYLLLSLYFNYTVSSVGECADRSDERYEYSKLTRSESTRFRSRSIRRFDRRFSLQ